MQSFVAGTDIQITLPFQDAAGQPVVGPESATITLTWSDGTTAVGAPRNLTPAGTDAGANLLITAAESTLRPGYLSDAIQITMQVVKDGRQSVVTEQVLVTSTNPLVERVNSFQTIGQALVSSTELINVDHFLSATSQDRARALIAAFHGLNSLTFLISGKRLRDLTLLSEDGWAALPANFLRALRMAQVVEANEYLNLDSIHRKRQEGVMSESIGESSIFFRPEKVLLLPVTRRSFDLLRGWVSWQLEISRG